LFDQIVSPPWKLTSVETLWQHFICLFVRHLVKIKIWSQLSEIMIFEPPSTFAQSFPEIWFFLVCGYFFQMIYYPSCLQFGLYQRFHELRTNIGCSSSPLRVFRFFKSCVSSPCSGTHSILHLNVKVLFCQ
jgi:hypothetical protein